MLVNVLKNHTAILDSTASFNVTANKTTDTGSLLEYFAQLDALADVTRDITATLDFIFSQTISENLIKQTSSTQDSTFTLEATAQGFKLHEGAATLESSFIQTSSADRIREDSTTQDSAFIIEAKITQIFEGIVLQASLGTMNISADRIREDTFTFDAIATSLITGEFVPQEASATLESAVTVDAVFEKIIQESTTQTSTADALISPERIRETTIVMPFAFTPSMVIGELAEGSINLNANSSVIVSVRKLKTATVTASSTFSSNINAIEYIRKNVTLYTYRPYTIVPTTGNVEVVYDNNRQSYVLANNTDSNASVRFFSGQNNALGFGTSSDFCIRFRFNNNGFWISMGHYFESQSTLGGQLKLYINNNNINFSIKQNSADTSPQFINVNNSNQEWRYYWTIKRVNGILSISSTDTLYNTTYILTSQSSTKSYNPLYDRNEIILYPGTRIDDFSYQVGTALDNFSNASEIQETVGQSLRFNFDFENGLNDNTGYILTTPVSLSSTSSLSTSSTRKRTGATLQASLGSLTTIIGAIYPRSASLSSAFTANITGMFKPQEAEAQLASTSSMSVTGDKYKITSLNATSQFTLSANGRADFSAASLEASLGTMNIVPLRIKQLASTQTSAFNSVFNGRFKPFEAVVPLQSTFISTPNPIEYRKRMAPRANRPLQWKYWDQYSRDWRSSDMVGYVHIDTTNYINGDGFDGGHKLRIGPQYVPSSTPLAGSYGNIDGRREIQATTPIADAFIDSLTDFCFKVDFYWGGNWSDGNVTYIPNVGVTIGEGSIQNPGGITIRNGQVIFYTGTTRRQINVGGQSGVWYSITVRRTNKVLTVSNFDTVLFTLTNNQDYINLGNGILSIYANDGYDNPPSSYVGVGIFDNISLQIGSSVYNFVDFDEVAEDLVYFTMFHLNFENPAAVVDKTSLTFYGDAALTSTATMAINLNRVKGIATLQASLGTLTSIPSVLRENSTSQSATFSADITGMFKPQEAEAQLLSTANLTATGQTFKEVSSSMNAFASQLAVNIRILKTGTNLIADTALEANPIVFYFNGVVMQSQASAVFANNTIRTDSSTIESAFTAAIDTQDSLAKVASASLTSTATLSTTGVCLRTDSATLPVIASELTATMRLAGLLVDDNTQANLTVTGVIKSGSIVDFNTISTQSVLTGKIQQATINLVSAFGKQFNATTNIIGHSDQQAEFTQTANSIVTFFGNVDLHAFGNSSTSVKITRTDGVDLFLTATMTISSNRIRLATTTINTNAYLAINAGKIEQATINAQMTATMTAVGRFIHIEDYIYIIPREYREFAIHSENRDFVIAQETREYIIGD
jgi:hypothetical protein